MLKTLISKWLGKSNRDFNTATMTDTQVINTGHLPCCGHEEYLAGPTAGISQNIQCSNPDCGQKWNLAFLQGICFYAEKI